MKYRRFTNSNTMTSHLFPYYKSWFSGCPVASVFTKCGIHIPPSERHESKRNDPRCKRCGTVR